MNRRSIFWICLALLALAGSLRAANFDREVFGVRAVELPWVDLHDVEFSGLRAEIAYGETVTREPQLRTTKSWCVPKGSQNAIKDAVEMPTHYYEIRHTTSAGVLVLRDASGEVRHTARLEELDSSDRFGYDQCKYWMESNLKKDWASGSGKFAATVRDHVREYFTSQATRLLDDAIFVRVIEEKIPLFTFKDKKHDYSDLDKAAEVARAAYRGFPKPMVELDDAGREKLQAAIVLWEAALEESDLGDKKARINRKVSSRLHTNLGVAKMLLDETREAARHLEKATQYSAMSTSRSNGTGSYDLLVRTQDRERRARRNSITKPSGAELDAMIATAERHRGRVPVQILPPMELARLEEIHIGTAVADTVNDMVEEAELREQEIASGERNPYESQVGNTASQGFILFLMPYPKKMDAFPAEVCELTHLNRLRMPNHNIASVPEEIGNLEDLEVLDLSGNQLSTLPGSIADLIELRKLSLKNNQLETLPEGIGKLQNLRTLELKGNPIAAGELERLKRVLPKCKIKA